MKKRLPLRYAPPVVAVLVTFVIMYLITHDVPSLFVAHSGNSAFVKTDLHDGAEESEKINPLSFPAPPNPVQSTPNVPQVKGDVAKQEEPLLGPQPFKPTDEMAKQLLFAARQALQARKLSVSEACVPVFSKREDLIIVSFVQPVKGASKIYPRSDDAAVIFRANNLSFVGLSGGILSRPSSLQIRNIDDSAETVSVLMADGKPGTINQSLHQRLLDLSKQELKKRNVKVPDESQVVFRFVKKRILVSFLHVTPAAPGERRGDLASVSFDPSDLRVLGCWGVPED